MDGKAAKGAARAPGADGRLAGAGDSSVPGPWPMRKEGSRQVVRNPPVPDGRAGGSCCCVPSARTAGSQFSLPGRGRQSRSEAPGLAASLSNPGIWLSTSGRPAETLPAALEAVALFRELVAVSPDWHRPRPRRLAGQPR